MEPNLIRSIIFLIAGLVSIMLPEKIINIKIYKNGYKSKSEKKHAIFILRIFGIIFLIIALILFIVSITF